MREILNILGFPSDPTEEEVLTALDLDKWRTSMFIGDLIDASRKASDQPNGLDGRSLGEILSGARSKICSVLRELVRNGLAEETTCSQLSVTEMAATDDERISSATKIHEGRKIRGGRHHYAYRKGKGTLRKVELLHEEGVNRESLGNLAPA
jgi:hypothetical protein